MNKLKIATRLLILVGTLTLVLLLIGGLGLLGMGQANSGLKTVYEDRTVPMGQLLEVQRLVLRNRLAVSNAVAVGTPESIQANTSSLDANTAEIDKVWAAYLGTELTGEEVALAKAFEVARGRYVQEFLTPVKTALRANELEAARQMMVDKDEALYAPVRDGVTALTALQLRVAKQEYDGSVARYGVIRLISLVCFVLGLGLAVVLGWSLIKGITRSLSMAIQSANAVAQGDLSRDIHASGSDEVAQLLHALSAMQEGLREVVTKVRQGSDAVSVASAEIAHGNQDLSARTENQASALEETAASMEELSSTVRQNAENALQANELAQSASTVAVQGGAVVGQVVQTMKGISDSSKKIADIIAVIDGIAFQTNILALNAAVEAARAGEQGRGFAVVAGEVRTLAGRSAEAAKEIKQLIDDSVGRVERGTALVDAAGRTMQEVVASIQRVTAIMAEISAASSEQSAGVGQVGEAVSQMDQATQQNAALVEEMAAAATSLRGQAQELVNTVAVFKVQRSAHGGAHAADVTHF